MFAKPTPDPAAAERGQKGGKTRAERMTPEQRCRGGSPRCTGAVELVRTLRSSGFSLEDWRNGVSNPVTIAPAYGGDRLAKGVHLSLMDHHLWVRFTARADTAIRKQIPMHHRDLLHL